MIIVKSLGILHSLRKNKFSTCPILKRADDKMNVTQEVKFIRYWTENI